MPTNLPKITLLSKNIISHHYDVKENISYYVIRYVFLRWFIDKDDNPNPNVYNTDTLKDIFGYNRVGEAFPLTYNTYILKAYDHKNKGFLGEKMLTPILKSYYNPGVFGSVFCINVMSAYKDYRVIDYNGTYLYDINYYDSSYVIPVSVYGALSHDEYYIESLKENPDINWLLHPALFFNGHPNWDIKRFFPSDFDFDKQSKDSMFIHLDTCYKTLQMFSNYTVDSYEFILTDIGGVNILGINTIEDKLCVFLEHQTFFKLKHGDNKYIYTPVIYSLTMNKYTLSFDGNYPIYTKGLDDYCLPFLELSVDLKVFGYSPTELNRQLTNIDVGVEYTDAQDFIYEDTYVNKLKGVKTKVEDIRAQQLEVFSNSCYAMSSASTDIGFSILAKDKTDNTLSVIFNHRALETGEMLMCKPFVSDPDVPEHYNLTVDYVTYEPFYEESATFPLVLVSNNRAYCVNYKDEYLLDSNFSKIFYSITKPAVSYIRDVDIVEYLRIYGNNYIYYTIQDASDVRKMYYVEISSNNSYLDWATEAGDHESFYLGGNSGLDTFTKLEQLAPVVYDATLRTFYRRDVYAYGFEITYGDIATHPLGSDYIYNNNNTRHFFNIDYIYAGFYNTFVEGNILRDGEGNSGWGLYAAGDNYAGKLGIGITGGTYYGYYRVKNSNGSYVAQGEVDKILTCKGSDTTFFLKGSNLFYAGNIYWNNTTTSANVLTFLESNVDDVFICKTYGGLTLYKKGTDIHWALTGDVIASNVASVLFNGRYFLTYDNKLLYIYDSSDYNSNFNGAPIIVYTLLDDVATIYSLKEEVALYKNTSGEVKLALFIPVYWNDNTRNFLTILNDVYEYNTEVITDDGVLQYLDYFKSECENGNFIKICYPMINGLNNLEDSFYLLAYAVEESNNRNRIYNAIKSRYIELLASDRYHEVMNDKWGPYSHNKEATEIHINEELKKVYIIKPDILYGYRDIYNSIFMGYAPDAI